MAKRILHVVTNTNEYKGHGVPTGLFLGELANAWEVFDDAGFEQTIISPFGGPCPLDPTSLRSPGSDEASDAWYNDPQKMALLTNTKKPGDVLPADFDAIHLNGGHGVMYDYPDSVELQRIVRTMFEAGKLVATVCHGYCGLVNVKLSDGSYLVAGRRLTGFSWHEEVLAGVDELVPYNIEQLATDRGARYEKGDVPLKSHTVIDGMLLSGENPPSARDNANNVVKVLTS